jgi:hypothetical protein
MTVTPINTASPIPNMGMQPIRQFGLGVGAGPIIFLSPVTNHVGRDSDG